MRTQKSVVAQHFIVNRIWWFRLGCIHVVCVNFVLFCLSVSPYCTVAYNTVTIATKLEKKKLNKQTTIFTSLLCLTNEICIGLTINETHSLHNAHPTVSLLTKFSHRQQIIITKNDVSKIPFLLEVIGSVHFQYLVQLWDTKTLLQIFCMHGVRYSSCKMP